jgi:anhydro-N-acetylmuramic acid kinase
MRVIGLMSGTSADGVDAALVEWPHGEAARPFRLLAQREDPFPAELQQRIHALAAGRCAPDAALRELAALDVALGERFAEAARAVAEDAGVRSRRSTRSRRTARPSRTTPSCARRSRSATRR